MAEATLTAAPTEEAPEVESLETTSPAAAESVEAPASAVEASGKLTLDEYREILRNGDLSLSKPDKDPLAPEEESDPLLSRGEQGERIEAAEPEAEAEIETAPEETPAAEEAPVAEADPAPTPEPEGEEDPTANLPGGRVRFNVNAKTAEGEHVFSPQQRATILYAQNNKVSFDSAWATLYPGQRQEAMPAEAPAAKPAEAKAPTVAEIDAQIAQKETQLDAAGENYDAAATAKLTREILKLNRERDNAARAEEKAREAAAQQAREQATTFEQQEQEAWKETAGMYPEAAKEGTELHAAVQAEIDRLEQAGDPVLQSPRWVKIITRDVADRLGIAPKLSTAAKPAEAAPAAKAKPAAAAAPKPAAPLRRAVPLPGPGGVSGGGPSPAQTLSQRIQAAKAANDLPALKGLMREASKLAA